MLILNGIILGVCYYLSPAQWSTLTVGLLNEGAVKEDTENKQHSDCICY